MIARWVWIVMMIGTGVEFAFGVACLVLVPIGRPDQWLPPQSKGVYIAHAVLGGLLAISALAILVAALGGRPDRPRRAVARRGRRDAVRVTLVEADGNGIDVCRRARRLLRISHSPRRERGEPGATTSGIISQTRSHSLFALVRIGREGLRLGQLPNHQTRDNPGKKGESQSKKRPRSSRCSGPTNVVRRREKTQLFIERNPTSHTVHPQVLTRRWVLSSAQRYRPPGDWSPLRPQH